MEGHTEGGKVLVAPILDVDIMQAEGPDRGTGYFHCNSNSMSTPKLWDGRKVWLSDQTTGHVTPVFLIPVALLFVVFGTAQMTICGNLFCLPILDNGVSFYYSLVFLLVSSSYIM